MDAIHAAGALATLLTVLGLLSCVLGAYAGFEGMTSRNLVATCGGGLAVLNGITLMAGGRFVVRLARAVNAGIELGAACVRETGRGETS